MAILVKQPDGPRSMLLSRHLVGRSRLADLRMTEPTVSGEHAVLRWTGRYQILAFLSVQNLIFCALWACYAFGGLNSPSVACE